MSDTPDMLSIDEMLKPATPDARNPWPNSPPEEGKVYGFTCPRTGAAMAAMTQDTFLNYGTQMESMRRAAAELDAKCKELHAQHAGLVTQYNDLAGRHEALREKLRSDRLAALEKKIVGPDDKAVRQLAKR